MDEKDKKKLDDVTKRVRKAAKEGRIEFAPTAFIEMYPELVDEVLCLIGHPDAWVSDMSSLSNFDFEKSELIPLFQERFGCDISEVVHKDFQYLIPYIAENRQK